MRKTRACAPCQVASVTTWRYRSTKRPYLAKERTSETIGGYPVGTDFGHYVKKVARLLVGPPDLVDAVIQNCARHIRDAYEMGYGPEVAAEWAYNQCTTITGRLRPQFKQPKYRAKERTSETVGGYPVGSTLGWYVRSVARALEKMVREINPSLTRAQIDFVVSKSLMRCNRRIESHLKAVYPDHDEEDAQWMAGSVYRACASNIDWPFPVRSVR